MSLLNADYNKRLKDAASARPDTRPRVGRSVELSAQVSHTPSSNKSSVVRENKTQITDTPEPAFIPSDPVKGSYEGYMRSAPAYIQMNNTGYDNPKNQQARQLKNISGKNQTHIQNIKSLSNSFNKSNNSGIMINYSKVMKAKTSGAKIAEINKIERMFK
jgi:hypothetical protein